MSTCRHLTLVDAFHFISERNEEIPSYFEATFCSVKNLFTSSFGFAHSLLFFIYYVLLGVVRLATAIMPQLLTFSSVVVSFHLHQLTWMDICLEIALLTIMALVYCNNKEIMAYIHSLEESLQKSQESLQKQSQAATTRFLGVAPHVAFFGLAMVFAVLGRRFLSPLSSHMPLFSLVLPIFTTIYGSLSTISQGIPRMGEPNTSNTANNVNNSNNMRIQLADMNSQELEDAAIQGRQTILLWIVLACYHSIATLCSLIPFAEYVFNLYLPFIKEMALVVVVWSQLSPLFIEIVYEVTSPSLTECSQRIPSASFEKKNSLVLIEGLEHMHIIDDTTGAFLRAALMDGTSLLIIVIFCITPTYVATFGVIVIALLLPAIRASTVVKEWEVAVKTEKEAEQEKEKEKEEKEGMGRRARGSGGSKSTHRNSAAGNNDSDDDDDDDDADRGSGGGFITTTLTRLSANVSRAVRGIRRSLSPLRQFVSGDNDDDSGKDDRDEDGDDDDGEQATEAAEAPPHPSGPVVLASPSIVGSRTHLALTQVRSRAVGPKGGGSGGRGARGARGHVHFTIGVFASGRKIKKSERQTRKIIAKQKKWMEYFICLAVVWTLRCYSLSLWPSITMVLCWCLCHSNINIASPLSRHIAYLVRLLPMVCTPWIIVTAVKGLWRVGVGCMSTRVSLSASHENGDNKEKRDGNGNDDAYSDHDDDNPSTNQVLVDLHYTQGAYPGGRSYPGAGEGYAYDELSVSTPDLHCHDIAKLQVGSDGSVSSMGSVESPPIRERERDKREGESSGKSGGKSSSSRPSRTKEKGGEGGEGGEEGKSSPRRREGSRGPARKRK